MLCLNCCSSYLVLLIYLHTMLLYPFFMEIMNYWTCSSDGDGRVARLSPSTCCYGITLSDMLVKNNLIIKYKCASVV